MSDVFTHLMDQMAKTTLSFAVMKAAYVTDTNESSITAQRQVFKEINLESLSALLKLEYIPFIRCCMHMACSIINLLSTNRFNSYISNVLFNESLHSFLMSYFGERPAMNPSFGLKYPFNKLLEPIDQNVKMLPERPRQRLFTN